MHYYLIDMIKVLSHVVSVKLDLDIDTVVQETEEHAQRCLSD